MYATSPQLHRGAAAPHPAAHARAPGFGRLRLCARSALQSTLLHSTFSDSRSDSVVLHRSRRVGPDSCRVRPSRPPDLATVLRCSHVSTVTELQRTRLCCVRNDLAQCLSSGVLPVRLVPLSGFLAGSCASAGERGRTRMHERTHERPDVDTGTSKLARLGNSTPTAAVTFSTAAGRAPSFYSLSAPRGPRAAVNVQCVPGLL